MSCFVSPCNHSDSYLSGSTIESMINKHKELGIEYFACTDHASLTGALKAYIYAEKVGIKPILGMEIYFKDNNCDIVRDTESANIKYFKLIIHAKDQEAYQKLVKKISTVKSKIFIQDKEYPSFDWNDLEELSKYNFTVATSDVECMVSKHLLIGRADLGLRYYKKIKDIFGAENFYPTIIPVENSQYWSSFVEIELPNKTVYIPSNDRIETDRFKKAKAIELTRRNNRHKFLQHIYINKIKYAVKKEFQTIKSAKLVNKFENIKSGDLQLKANKFILKLAEKFKDTDRLLINNYSYYANKEDKAVQNMKLGDTDRYYQSFYVRDTKDVFPYLKKELELENEMIGKIVKNSYKWASNFDDFKLEYPYRLVTYDDPKKMMLDRIKQVGRMKWDNPKWVKQFKHELDILENNGRINLVPYFLPIVDVFDYYNKNGQLVGPGRGSASGFLISYLLGVTHLDPFEYGLSSSRFITLGRVKSGKMPDIDVDLNSRELLVGTDGNGGYLKEKYGDRYAQCSTRGLLRIKSAILDANRFVNGGKVEEEIEKLAKSLPTTPQGVEDQEYIFGYEENDGTHREGLLEKNEDLQQYAVDRPQEWDIVKRSLSLTRQFGRHACFAANTLIKVLKNGKEIHKPIVECDGELVFTGQGNIGTCKLLDQGLKEVFEFTTEKGDVFKCTSDHKVLSSKGKWVSIEEAYNKGIDVIDFNSKRIKLKKTKKNTEGVFKNCGYTLIEKTQNGKYRVQCPNGHITEVFWGNFYGHGKRCKECPKTKYTKKKIISLLTKGREDLSFKDEDIKGWRDKVTFFQKGYGYFKASPQALIKEGVNHPKKAQENRSKNMLKTRIERYGEENKTWNNPKKAKETLKKKYGVESPFMVNNGREKTMLKRYGTTYPLKNKKIKNRFLDTLKRNNISTMIGEGTSLRDYHKTVCDKISYNKLFVDYKNGKSLKKTVEDNLNRVTSIESIVMDSFKLKKMTKGIKVCGKLYKPDFKLSDTLYVNVDGLYWHSDYIKKDNKYHFNMRERFQKEGLTILQFREDEILFKLPIVKSMVNNHLNKDITTIYARKCQINKVDQKEATKFLKENHLMGDIKAKHIGLYLDNELVSIFSHKKYSKNLKIERFCSKINHRVVGGFSKLLKQVPKEGVKEIHYWTDLRYGTGKHLINRGFYISHETLGWKWTDLKNTYNRRFCRANMDERKLSEREHANELGLLKIYDAGQRLYIYEINKV